MKHKFFVLLLASALFVSFACSGHHAKTIACGPEEAQPVPFGNLLTSSGSADDQSERFLVIGNQADFDDAWKKLFDPNTAPPLPPVDFQNDMVIVYAMGSQPNGCYSAEIEEVLGSGPELLVKVRELEPGPSCVCTQSIVMPFDVIRVAAHKGPVSLCVRRSVRQCE